MKRCPGCERRGKVLAKMKKDLATNTEKLATKARDMARRRAENKKARSVL